MPMYDYTCKHCNVVFPALVTYENRDTPEMECPVCSRQDGITRNMAIPTLTKASYPEGYKRPGWGELREAAKLNVEKANTPYQNKAERKRLDREINKLTKESAKKTRNTHDQYKEDTSEKRLKKIKEREIEERRQK